MRLTHLVAALAALAALAAAPAPADTVPPSVQSVTPAAGPATGGTVVTIVGQHFGGTTDVSFGSTPAGSFTVGADETTITAVAPPGSGLVDVTVATQQGRSARGSADRFTYRPAVTGIAPAQGSVSGDTEVTISGAGLADATAVRFGKKAASDFTVVSDRKIVAVAPEAGGAVYVTVTGPTGTSPADPDARYEYLLGVTGSSPGPGGNQVSLTGIGFGVATAVRVGSSFAGFAVVSDTKLIAVVPAGTKPASISVVTPYGSTKGIDSSLLAGVTAGTSATAAGNGFAQGPSTTPAMPGVALQVVSRPRARVGRTSVRIDASVRTARPGLLLVALVDARGAAAAPEAQRRLGDGTVTLTVPRRLIRSGQRYRLRVRSGATSAYSASFTLR